MSAEVCKKLVVSSITMLACSVFAETETPVWPDYVPCTPSNRYTIEGAIPVVKQLYTDQLNSLNDDRFPLPRQFDLVTIGDSITDNWDTRDKDNYLALADSVFNLGIGGDRIEQLLWRLEVGGCNNFKAKYITLLIGTNNSYQRRMEENVDPDKPVEMAKGIERVLWNLTTGHPEAKILLMPILPYEKLHDERGAVCRANNENVNDLIINFVDNKQVFWLDIRGGFLNADGSFNDTYWSASGEAGSDGKGHYLHPSSAGYSQVFDPAVRAAMTKIDASVSADTAQETDPSLGYASASVDSWNSQVTMKLSGVYVGTDSSTVKASSYKIEYKLDGGEWTTACENQTLTRNTFVIENVAIGQHTCEIKVTTSAGKSVTTVSQFTMSDAWMAEALGATSASVRTEGDLVCAYAADGNYTVAGVAFTKASGSVDDSNIKWPFGATGGSQAPTGVESGGYADLLTHCWWMNPGTGGKQETITLKGLTPGNEYLVQLFSYRSAYNEGLLYVVGTQADTTFIRAGGDGWPYGGTLVGKFTADATTKDIVIQIEGATALNGIQVRSLGSGEPIPVNPSIGSVSASVNGSTATISLAGIVKGTDDNAVAATSYSVSYSLNSAAAVTALSNQSAATAQFDISNLADGDYTCSVTITTDKNKTSVAKSVNFTIKTSTPGGDDDPDEPVAKGWTVEPMSENGDNIRKDGEVIGAYSIQGGEVNGVTFSMTRPVTGNLTVSPAPVGSRFGDFGWGGLSAGSSYRDMISHASYWNSGSTVDITFGNLTSGHKYLVQFVSHNDSAKGVTISAEGTAPQHICSIDGDDAYKRGASIVGVFTAQGTSKTVTVTFAGLDSSSGKAGEGTINAIQIRDLGKGGEDPVDPEEPLPIYTLTIPAQDHLSVESVKTNNVAVTGSGNDYSIVSNTEVTITFAAETGYEITGGNPVVVTVESNMTLAEFPTVQEKQGGDDPEKPVATGWTVEPMSESGDTIRKDGEVIGAYSIQGGEVNGVTFSMTRPVTGKLTVSPAPVGSRFGDFGWGGLSAGSSYRDMISHASYWNSGSTVDITFGNLTSGHKYLVQFVSHNDSAKGVTISAEGTAPQHICSIDGDDAYKRGASIVGVFTAQGTSKTVTVTFAGLDSSSGKAGEGTINAIQIRDLGKGGDEPTPTIYAVSWTGGANATVDAKVDGAAISSGADVEDGKSVVFTVTPNTNYEFAEASYADWTKSGEALTRTVTVNGAAVDITIPNATEKTTPPGPTPEHTSGPMSASGDTLCTDGDLLYAYSILDSEVSGVSFVRTIPISGGANVAFSEVVDGSKFGDFGNEGDWSQYGNILSHASYWSSADSLTVELKSLTAGRKYLVQFVVHNSSASGDMTVSINEGAVQYVNGKTQSDYKYGASLVYEFTASADTEQVTLTYSGSGDRVVNAIQVRVLPGDEPTPTTYAVSWTGGANASVVAKVDGAQISSGADVEDGKSVVFTVTPNTNYEFAEASYTDWTKSGEALTRTVTVNGAAVSVTIPTATEKTTPPGPVLTEGWTAEPMTASESVIRKDGTLLCAYAASEFEVNGIQFIKCDTPNGEYMSTSPEFSNLDGSCKNEGVSGDLGKMFCNSWVWNSGSEVSVTLSGLTAGNTYLVQVIAHHGWNDNVHVWVGDTDKPLTGANGLQDQTYKYGANIVGVFKATAASEAFVLKYDGGGRRIINAIQVRNLGAPPKKGTVIVYW